MKRKILLDNQEVEYDLKKSARARRMKLSIFCDGNFVVTVPQYFQENLIEKFILEKINWISKKLKYFQKFQGRVFLKTGKKDFLEKKETALTLARSRAGYFCELYGFQHARISVKNQKTRWGSCSRKGNLSFNYKIIYLPEKLRDYIILHEVCHLGEFNHSRNFWNLVAKTMPDYKKVVQEIKKFI